MGETYYYWKSHKDDEGNLIIEAAKMGGGTINVKIDKHEVFNLLTSLLAIAFKNCRKVWDE